MFNQIEKEYRQGLLKRRFWIYYWRHALPVAVVAFLICWFLRIPVWFAAVIVLVVLIAFVARFFVRDIRIVLKKFKKESSLKAKLAAYAKVDREIRLANLVASLQAHHITSKEDLKLTLDYFLNQQPTATKTSVLEWVLSVAVALTSTVALAYDTTIQAFSITKFLAIIGPTVGIVVVIVIPILLIGVIVNRTFFSETQIESILAEDLACLYINYDEMKKQLTA